MILNKCAFGLLFWLALNARAQVKPSELVFLHDTSDEIIHATVLDNPSSYDVGAAVARDGLWLAWLEFQPGKGDLLWIGHYGRNGWIKKTLVQEQPGEFANPTPTVDAKGSVWLSYESARDGGWDIFVQEWKPDATMSPARKINSAAGVAINYQVAADTESGLWFVWQGDNNGQFDIMARRISGARQTEISVVSASPFGDWQPALTVSPSGNLNVVWDGYDGNNYQIFGRSFNGVNWGKVTRATTCSVFQAHAQIASRPGGSLVWMLWEEDAKNWGKRSHSQTPGDPQSTGSAGKIVSLHRSRKLELEEFAPYSVRRIEVPMPSLKSADSHTDARANVDDTGAFYENGRLTVDGKGRLWLTYRHCCSSVAAVSAQPMPDRWMLYSRCLLPAGWSKLYSFDLGQSDGLQRLSVVPEADGITAVWTTGRMGGNNNNRPRGIALGRIALGDKPKNAMIVVSTGNNRDLPVTDPRPIPRGSRSVVEVAGRHYELFFGDLHRHTDLSLDFTPGDGSIDDTYRYAIDAATLDFLAITDDTRDLALDDQLGFLRWGSRKEVSRHQLPDTFVPFYGSKRRHGDTDFSIISLHDDTPRPPAYPMTQVWAEMDTNTFTIPQPPFNADLWDHQDDSHCPLFEIYDALGNDSMEKNMQEGLRRGHKFGIIAGSDHLSTDDAFACVWSEKADRESLFRALQSRRTYGATARIQLKVFAGEHWMGESFTTNTMPPIHIEAFGTARITSCDILVDGVVKQSFPGTGLAGKFTWQADTSLTGPHIFYVRMEQADGNRAWASPIWVNIKP